MKTLFFISFITLLACSRASSGGAGVQQPVTDTTFTNPLLSSGPDPWVLQKDGYYYFMRTLGNRLAIWKTQYVDKLSNATPVTVWTPPSGTAYSTDLWAPELHFLDNKWYIYFAADSAGNNATHRIYVLENAAADPLNASTWVFKGKLMETADRWAIDATIFTYNGVNYAAWSGWQGNTDGEQDIYIAKMLNPYTLGSRVLISKPTYPWEKISTNVIVNEGPEALFNSNGSLYLTYSANGCWTDDYCLGMLSLKPGGDPLNAADWVKSPNAVFTKNTGGNVFGPGHNAFFKSPDGKEDWIIYHANSLSGQGCGDQRNPRMQKIGWNADGTPNFGIPVGTSVKIKKPSGE